MLTGVEILLERMKTNPEEFIEGGLSKWSRVLDTGWSVMTTEEQKALQDGMNEAKREHFNGEVLRVLAQGHDDQLGRAEPQEPNKMIVPQSMVKQANKILRDEMDKQRASSPYQQRK
jgi:hypothetical protein